MASQACIAVIDGLLHTFDQERSLQVSTTTAKSEEPKQYRWDWSEKLNASPFRQEMKRLKLDSKANPSSKSSNRASRRRLKAQEKEFLIDFQMKCDAAKIWINEAHQNYADATHDPNDDNPAILQQIAIQRKEEKIRTIDQFWEEMICYQTVFLQNEKIKRQKEQMAQLQKQLNQQQAQLASIHATKAGISPEAFAASQANKFEANSTATKGAKVSGPKKKKRRKNKADKDQYQGLVGYFNRAKPSKSNKTITKKDKSRKKEKESNGDQGNNANGGGGFLSYSYVPNVDAMEAEDRKKQKEKEAVKEKGKKETIKPKQVQKEKEETSAKQKGKSKKGARSMKGGFLKAGTNGLYDDKKQDSELTVDERNIKNRKHIEEMGLAEAVDKPFYTWERPKEEREAYQKEMENAAKSNTNQ